VYYALPHLTGAARQSSQQDDTQLEAARYVMERRPCKADTVLEATYAAIDEAIPTLRAYYGDNIIAHAHIVNDLDELEISKKARREDVIACAKYAIDCLQPELLLGDLKEPTLWEVISHMAERGISHDVRRAKLEFDIHSLRNSGQLTQEQTELHIARAHTFNMAYDIRNMYQRGTQQHSGQPHATSSTQSEAQE